VSTRLMLQSLSDFSCIFALRNLYNNSNNKKYRSSFYLHEINNNTVNDDEISVCACTTLRQTSCSNDWLLVKFIMQCKIA